MLINNLIWNSKESESDRIFMDIDNIIYKPTN